MPATNAGSSLTAQLARTLSALERVAWDQDAPSCTVTRRNAAAALFGNAGVWKDALQSEESQAALAALQTTLKLSADTNGLSTTSTQELPGWRELLLQLNAESAERIGKVGVVFGAAQVKGNAALKHCFTIVAAPHLVANRFWVFHTLGCSDNKRSAADEQTLARLLEQAGPSLEAARNIYKNHEKHLLFGIDGLADRLFAFGAQPHEISEWHPIWLE